VVVCDNEDATDSKFQKKMWSRVFHHQHHHARRAIRQANSIRKTSQEIISRSNCLLAATTKKMAPHNASGTALPLESVHARVQASLLAARRLATQWVQQQQLNNEDSKATERVLSDESNAVKKIEKDDADAWVPADRPPRYVHDVVIKTWIN
jgi:hypothetical protein